MDRGIEGDLEKAYLEVQSTVMMHYGQMGK